MEVLPNKYTEKSELILYFGEFVACSYMLDMPTTNPTDTYTSYQPVLCTLYTGNPEDVTIFIVKTNSKKHHKFYQNIPPNFCNYHVHR